MIPRSNIILVKKKKKKKNCPIRGTFLTCRVGFHLGSKRCTTKMRKESLQEGMGYGDIEWAWFVGSGLCWVMDF